MKGFILLALMINYSAVSYCQKMNIETNSKAKAYAIDSIEINAPLEKVYYLLADINNWPDWFDGVSETKVIGTVQEGSEFIWKAKGYKIKSRLHTLRANSDMGWTGKMWWIKATHNWNFKNSENGKTIVVVQENFSGLGSSFMKNSLKKDMRKDLLALKTASEKSIVGNL